jgi:predicted patatin/cPLA2 family phospholipase
VDDVLRVIDERVRTGSQPGQRSDGLRVALAIEGGGMRGTVSAGMALALHELGLMPAFDAVYGSSAGAITGAWLLSSEPERLRGWAHPDYARTMIRWSALLHRRPVADVRTLVEVVYQTEWPMDFDSILASPVEYHPLATDAATGQSTDLRPMISNPAELRLAIRASAALPFLAGPPVRLRGRRYYDAGVAESVPFRTPLAQGATHILVLRSRRPLDTTDEPAAIDGGVGIDGEPGIDGWAQAEGVATTDGEAGIGGLAEAEAEAEVAAAAGRRAAIVGGALTGALAAAGVQAGTNGLTPAGGRERTAKARSAAASSAMRALRRARQLRRGVPTGQGRPPRSVLLLTRTTLRNESPEFRTALLTRATRTAADLKAIADGEAEGTAFAIYPPLSTPPVSRLTTDAVLLAGALEAGREAVNAVFGERRGPGR